MKTLKKLSYIVLLTVLSSSCEDFLDQVPESKITPQAFLNSEADLATYALGGYQFYAGSAFNIARYEFHNDMWLNTNNGTPAMFWLPGMKRVPADYGSSQSAGGWVFNRIRNSNYFFEQVLPKLKAGAIIGNEANINHYIGEVHVNRACVYFDKLELFGDFPIITRTFTDSDKDLLVEANKRMPRNLVARFILADLDTAISLLSMTNKNRITKNAALLLKSRVALFEATWEKYHKGTPFVPGGPGWPGADYNPGFTINIDQEIDFFLTQAMDAAKQVADAVDLTPNSHVMNPDVGVGATGVGWNPYYEMYVSKNDAAYPEVLMWRDYDRSLGVYHTAGGSMSSGPNNGCGVTKQTIDVFLMQNGLPKYAAGSGFGLDSTIMLEKANRDERLQLFIDGETDVRFVDKPVQSNAYLEPPLKGPTATDGGGLWGYPPITFGAINQAKTGYMPRKYYPYADIRDFGNNDGQANYPVFRAAEAYLNYIEASYLKEGVINGTATTYWQKLRVRAGVDPDFQKTIANTDLTQETNLMRYSGTSFVDATTYNIRRERLCEFYVEDFGLPEGFRWMDMKRWRAYDMAKNYQPTGFNLWDNAYKNYPPQYPIINFGPVNANVSSPADGKYLYPYRTSTSNVLYNGWNWTEAYYLEPIGFQAFQLTTDDVTGNPQKTIYQNPYWPAESNGAAIQ
jgi:hypothetical protein